MRTYKNSNREQLLLMPPSLDDWLPRDHPARFVLETVELMDLSAFYEVYEKSTRGRPPYDPRMLLALLLYAVEAGVLSSRKIEQATTTDIAFRFITGNLQPDHDTIANFRRVHAKAIEDVFRQTVKIALQAKIVRLGHVAIDGTKMKANASKEKRRSKKQLEQELSALEKFRKQMNEAEAIDKAEDEEFGKGNNGYSLPPGLDTKEGRRKVILEALEEIKNKEKKEKEEDPKGLKRRAWEAKAGKPYETKVNITDHDSRTMLFRNNVYDEGYNTQLAVDDDHGIIVAAGISQDSGDTQNLLPMILEVQTNTGWLPDHATADAGYFNESQMKDARIGSVELYVKPRKKAITGKLPAKMDFGDRMRERLEEPLGRALYRARMTLVEPVFGAIKQARGLRQFRLRGLAGVRCEWALICAVHNLKKMFKVNSSLAALMS